MNQSAISTRLRDRLSYLRVYYPDFPSEDLIVFHDEVQEALSTLEYLARAQADRAYSNWLVACHSDLDAAVLAHASGDADRVVSCIGDAIEHFRHFSSRRTTQPRFIVDRAGGTADFDGPEDEHKA